MILFLVRIECCNVPDGHAASVIDRCGQPLSPSLGLCSISVCDTPPPSVWGIVKQHKCLNDSCLIEESEPRNAVRLMNHDRECSSPCRYVLPSSLWNQSLVVDNHFATGIQSRISLFDRGLSSQPEVAQKSFFRQPCKTRELIETVCIVSLFKRF